MNRRAFVQCSMGGIAALLGSRFLVGGARAAAPVAKAKAIIVLWMNGGPSHIDTFDPKAGTPLTDIATRAPSIRLSQHLPHLAEVSDKIAIVRGMTSREGNHQRAAYLLHTGWSPNATVEHPSLGAWVSEELGGRDRELPAFVAVHGPSVGAGFLGVAHGPFVVPIAGTTPQDTGLPRDVDAARFSRRQEALAYLDGNFAAYDSEKLKGRHAVYEQAVRMMSAPTLKAFDLDAEPAATSAAYGDTPFGRGCLLARRLVEVGVKYIEVTLDGWDTHQDNFNRTKAQMDILDPAFAALVKDLDERRLLGSTLVLCTGEFGRTPTVNINEGRDHYPAAWSCALAGGGLRGGIVRGATDETGARVVSDPTSVADLFATITSLTGIDPDKEFRTPLGRPIAITDRGTPIASLIA